MICEYRSKIYKLETAGNCILHKNSVQLQEKIFLAKDVNYIVPTSGSVLYQKCTKTRQCAKNIAGLLVDELVGPLLPYGILCIPKMYPSSVVTKCSSISYPQYLTSSGCKKYQL